MYWFLLILFLLAELTWAVGAFWLFDRMSEHLAASDSQNVSTWRFFLIWFPVLIVLSACWFIVLMYAGYIHFKECD